jgi:hypothetical protein
LHEYDNQAQYRQIRALRREIDYHNWSAEKAFDENQIEPFLGH